MSWKMFWKIALKVFIVSLNVIGFVFAPVSKLMIKFHSPFGLMLLIMLSVITYLIG